jgi:hypothetical protein
MSMKKVETLAMFKERLHTLPQLDSDVDSERQFKRQEVSSFLGKELITE